ncbi:glycoside hydrolase family 2 TIM barrel-domain containing protein [Blastomonas aquatica]|uniref:Beta-galactosidase n=1 Tax=Blastomonas aquatica TaxID=1510276 RepID=A0ABQ1J3D4_9SPHN|nr:glycoside hydrolase family 2 TIM barrel-domain containing protein [Blastomonas aquatica]GGB56438.1 beta-galactosidase [Blastomonas aquatica]
MNGAGTRLTGSLILGLAGAVAACTVPAAASAPAAAASAQQAIGSQVARQVIPITSGWRFRFGGDPAGVTATDYDDSGWDTVDLPHTWNRMGEYAQSRSASTNVDQGEGWYRLHMTGPVLGKSRSAVLEFDGVGSIADVWVNGAHVGTHKGAFSRFRFDVTDHLKPGQDNVIVVKADNSKPAPGSTTEHVIPLGGDFFVHGGLYRGVSLITTDRASIDLFDHGGPGVYVSTPKVTSQSVTVDVLTRLRNSGSGSRALQLVTQIIDAEGKVVATDTSPARLRKGESAEVRRSLALANPRLWNGRADPYLYTVTVDLRAGDRVIDSVSVPLGVRTFAFDADKGFILNGKPTRLYGASRHQDRQGKGWALTAEDHAEDMAIMAEMGVNTVRHAHYQHAQEWSDEADKAGMVVKAELPFVHQSAFGGAPVAPELVANARQQLVELVRQNYNHPSIMIWSVGNEIDIGAAIDSLRQGGKGPVAQSRDMLVELDALARSEDPSRPTAYADCCEGTPSPLSRPGAQTLNDVSQIIGLNRYFGWYYGGFADIEGALAKLRAKYPDRPIALTEYGAGGALTQHTDNPLGGRVNENGRPHPEAYQAWVHEETWKVLKQQDYLAGSWIWNMFDFASTSREEGEAFDLNDKGLVSYDRKTRKDAFYFYKANWSDEPVLHLTGRRYVDRPYAVVDVRAYSNAPSASLTVNGRDVGSAPCPDRICVWPGVVLAAGENAVSARATVGGKQVEDSLRWIAPDASKGIHVRTGSLTGLTTSDGLRFGSDTFFTGGNVPPMRMTGRGKAADSNVTQSPDPELYASYRQGSFDYALPLPNGRYDVVLHMFEPDAAQAATRTFHVSANGRRVLTNFNPASAAGGPLRAVTRTFPVQITDGKLALQFTAAGGDALVSAISVIPQR